VNQPSVNPTLGCPQIPPTIQLRNYQKEAIASWFANQGRGTLKMATGSGKTITALAIATELYQKMGLQVLLVICPYRHLVTQWGRECEKFNLQPILAFETVYNWQSLLSTQIYNIVAGNQSFLTVITTNSTLIKDSFQSQVRYFPQKTLIVGDEVHNLGSDRLEESLPRHLGLRLGLSATPERHFDELGTQSIFTYFGSVLQPELNLGDAIRLGALVHYLYYPILVELTEAESISYHKLTTRIGWALSKNPDIHIDDNELLTGLLIQRARLIGNAQNKLTALKEIMSTRLNTSHTLFYCGEGSVPSLDSEDPNQIPQSPIEKERQLTAVSRILGLELGYRINTYTAETPIQHREELRRQFETGELQGLVAIRCLDEGVDIPAIQTAVILASTSNPRQFIQRRGRILRPYPGKDYATLFDTIVIPPNLNREPLEIERNLLRKELKRFLEFAQLANNAESACATLRKVEAQYGL
jgi:DNA phosphorothioation system restriction enzyme